MTTKTTGAEWRVFYYDPDFWPKGAWHEDEELTVNGQDAPDALDDIKPTDSISISGGVVYKDADGKVEWGTLEGHFKRWRKKTNTSFFAVSVPIEVADAVRAAVRAAGGRIL